MPIRDETKSVTEGPTALELFVDRFDARRVLARYLHGEPQNRVLFFHGDGGNGKSLLLEFLRTQYCKCFPAREWTEIKASDEEAFARFLKKGREQYLYHQRCLILHRCREGARVTRRRCQGCYSCGAD
ncbi:MAG: hypothetical protein H0X37_12435 [Herpetosiphonaceae bacterium]|nr:hypothetical protein [Herpetosiphonaceae bacterium]